MKIVIIGANGQLGTDLCKIIPKNEQIPLTIDDIDITDFAKVKDVIEKYSPDVVINTAAYNKVDDCEDDVEIAMRVNAIGPRNLALVCCAKKIKLVHISTDYVFDGEKSSPYTIDDVPMPKTAYGISKLAGEFFVRYLLSTHFVIRTSGLFGVAGCLGKGGTNFVEAIISCEASGQKLKVVGDEIVTPTYAHDLARNIYELVKTDHFGLFHITNNGECSWFDFASKIFELLGKKVSIDKVSAKTIPTKAHRPKYSVLDNGSIKMRDWDSALRDYLIEKGHLVLS